MCCPVIRERQAMVGLPPPVSELVVGCRKAAEDQLGRLVYQPIEPRVEAFREIPSSESVHVPEILKFVLSHGVLREAGNPAGNLYIVHARLAVKCNTIGYATGTF